MQPLTRVGARLKLPQLLTYWEKSSFLKGCVVGSAFVFKYIIIVMISQVYKVLS